MFDDVELVRGRQHKYSFQTETTSPSIRLLVLEIMLMPNHSYINQTFILIYLLLLQCIAIIAMHFVSYLV